MAGKRKSRDEAFAASQRLMRERPEFNDSWKLIIAEWFGMVPDFRPTNSPDQAVAIVLTAVLEHALESALLTHFPVPKEEGRLLFQGRGDEEAPLHSLSAKIALGYALGVYDGLLKNDLKWIKNIRNAFAHTGRHILFETPEIATMVDALISPAVAPWGGLLGLAPTTPRNKFIAAVKVAFIFLAVDLPGDKAPKSYKHSEWYQTIFLRQRGPSS